jgi:hypothetical protein
VVRAAHPASSRAAHTVATRGLTQRRPIAYSPLGYQFTEWFLAGTPGAERQMEAFVPPM